MLLSHDCVIVPGFGGFIAHHVDARYDADDKLWLPPYRTLGFNQQLTLNDSLLVQSYIEAYDMSYPDALRQIEAEVDELKGILNAEGKYEMDGVGTIRVNSEGNYEFEPCEAGILSPEIYGLSDFSFKKLKDEEVKGVKEDEGVKDNSFVAEKITVGEAETEAVQETETKTVEDAGTETGKKEETPRLLDFIDEGGEDENHALVIKLSWVRNAVAIAAAIACFFLLASPVANSNFNNQAMSKLNSNIISKLMPKDSNMTPAKPVEVGEVKEAAEVKEAKEAAEAGDAEKDSDKANIDAGTDKEDAKTEVKEEKIKEERIKEERNTYCIVLASQVKRSNAEEYVEKLKKRGINDARIYIHHNILRVICGNYQNESEAYRQLNKMADEEGFAEAWVYRITEE